MADPANLAHIQGIIHVFDERLRGLCAGEADSADLAHIERNNVFHAFSGGCVLGFVGLAWGRVCRSAEMLSRRGASRLK